MEYMEYMEYINTITGFMKKNISVNIKNTKFVKTKKNSTKFFYRYYN